MSNPMILDLATAAPSNAGLNERFVDRFRCILRIPECASDTHAYVVREWVACTRWLTECKGHQSDLIAMLHAAGEQVLQISSLPPISAREARRQIHGETDEAPIYSMLLHLAVADGDLAGQLRPLASQILLAHATLIYFDGGRRIDLCRQQRPGKPPVPSLPSACRLLRQLAVGKHPELARCLPVDQTVFSSAYLNITARLPDTAASYAAPARAVSVIIRDARKLQPRRDRRGGPRRGAAGTQKAEEPLADLDDLEHQRRQKSVEDTRILMISPLSGHQPDEYRRAGLTPAEVRPQKVTLQSSSLRGEHPGASLSMRIRRQQGMVKDRSRANQRLPIQRGLPRHDEIQALVQDLKTWTEGIVTPVPTKEIAQTEAVGMLGLILATGASTEELHTLPVVADESAVPDGHLRAILTDNGLHLWVRVPAPEMDPDRYREVSDLLQPIQTGLVLPLPPPVVQLLQNVRRQAGTNGSATMFASDLDSLKSAAVERLRQINQRHRSRLQLARLPSVLPQVIADQSGNWSYAWILSGDGDPHAHTPLVYQTTPETRLVAVYREATAHIFGVPYDTNAESSPVASDERHFGSALCPLDGVWEGIARELRQAIPKTPSSLAGAAAHIEHHNALTLYTAMMALIGTGLRAVRDPIESALYIDWNSDLMYVADKAARANGNGRLIPLATTVIDQLRAYQLHLIALAFRWAPHHPQEASMLKAAASGNDASIPFLLFLSKDLQPTPVRPGTLSPRLVNLFPTPMNIGRHHIRTHLTESGCPGEWIDALLGHEPLGMEAYGPHSALGIDDTRKMTTKWIEPMLQKLGWTVVAGVPA